MRTIRRGGSRELEIRKSRFICTLARAADEAEAVEFLARHRRAHRDATHNCTAYVVGEHGEIAKSSDDGEPAGTAGIPMLEVLTRRGLTGTAAVVTRYFGGVKLGAGGLVRAYAKAVADTVDAVGVVELRPVVTVTVGVGHAQAGRFLGDLHARGAQPADVRYGQDVEADVAVPLTELAEFEAWAARVTAGRAVLRRGAPGHIEVPVTP
ncbi:IMPACT family protein [Actinomadura livida]|uniref:YigZ family protein n=1 Tax=Actinomadura livida TaxID=79909 RepID=A0A7W7MY19_9ACTN|nr:MULTISPECIES: YigZ family protein [Actinomadura]MBB4775343.1 putative YigZ family protein [Actinomadura catellatispora]GGT89675.1 YigZ family protein [Actinomadura livida]